MEDRWTLCRRLGMSSSSTTGFRTATSTDTSTPAWPVAPSTPTAMANPTSRATLDRIELPSRRGLSPPRTSFDWPLKPAQWPKLSQNWSASGGRRLYSTQSRMATGFASPAPRRSTRRGWSSTTRGSTPFRWNSHQASTTSASIRTSRSSARSSSFPPSSATTSRSTRGSPTTSTRMAGRR